MPPCRAGPWIVPLMRSGSNMFCWQFLWLSPSTTGNSFLYWFLSWLSGTACMSVAFPTTHLKRLFIIYLFRTFTNFYLIFIRIYIMLFFVYFWCLQILILLNYWTVLFAIFCGEIFSSVTCANQRVLFPCWLLASNKHIVLFFIIIIILSSVFLYVERTKFIYMHHKLLKTNFLITRLCSSHN